MTIYDLRDPSPHYGGVSMGPEDRTALSVAADRERARIWRKRWFETWVGKAAVCAGVAASLAEVWTALHH